MDISVVVPLYNEAESLPELHAWIERVMDENHFSYEIIYVNDGSTDGSWGVIERLARQSTHVKGIKFRRNYGKSPALHCGFYRAEGDVVITMDADLQDSPDEIPELYRMIREDGVRPALVIGMPVGFVSAAESKDLLAQVSETPWIIIRGRKGGSSLVVGAIHALLALAEARQKAAA